MLREIRDLGFECAELSHGIRISLLPGIMEAFDAGKLNFPRCTIFVRCRWASTHAKPNIFKFTSLDRRERDSAWRHSVKTIETAARLRAPLVVLHMGCVDMKDYTDRLLEMVAAGKQDTQKYADLCADALAKREKKKGDHVQVACELLSGLVGKAREHGIKLGIENRQAVEEISVRERFRSFSARVQSAGNRVLARRRPRAKQGKPRAYFAPAAFGEYGAAAFWTSCA